MLPPIDPLEFPERLTLELTNACNLRCAMCPSRLKPEEPRGMMDHRLFERLIDEAAEHLPVALVLEGLVLEGEPDIIVASEVLEHMSNPGNFLQAAKRFNCPLLVSVPNAFSYRAISELSKGGARSRCGAGRCDRYLPGLAEEPGGVAGDVRWPPGS